MLVEERHTFIRNELIHKGRVLAVELARQLDVSEDTIRRDLRDLAEDGFCQRVYGGALRLAPPSRPLFERALDHADEKRQLAQGAISLLKPNMTVFIDAGSTNTLIAAAIPTGLDITVVTNSPDVAVALPRQSTASVILLGGTLNASKGAALGGWALAGIRQINADLLFLGSCGLDRHSGVTAFDLAEADIKRAMVAQSAQVAVAATTDKLGTTAPFSILYTEALSHLIVSARSPSSYADEFARAGCNVIQVD